jgi:hypothetical protein
MFNFSDERLCVVIAMKENNIPLVEVLFFHGADLDLKDGNGESAIEGLILPTLHSMI